MAEVCILSPRDPIPVYSGLLERVYQLAASLGRDHDVRVLYPDEPTRRDESGRIPSVQPFERIGLRSRIVESLDVRVPGYSPWRGLYKTHPWLYPAIRRELRRTRPDTLIVEMPFLLPVAAAAARGIDTDVVLSEHNVQYRVTERLGIPGTTPLKWFETTVADLCDTIVTVSEADRAALAKDVSAPIRVAPNGVDTNQFVPDARRPDILTQYDHDPLLVYHGSLGNAQNREAVARLERLVSRLRNRLSDVGVLLIGADPPSVDTAGVHTTGLVDNLPAYVATPDIAVVPLESGSGTKLKILEYLAAGTPVVTTPIGAEGLPLKHGETAEVAETDAEIIDSVTRLAADEEQRDLLATAGRRLAETEFDWEHTLRPYADLVTTRE